MITNKFLNEMEAELVGEEISILNLSNKLQELGFEDICDMGGLEECIEDGNIVVAVDEVDEYGDWGEEKIHIWLKTTIEAGEDEVFNSTYVVITDIREF